MNTRSHCMDVRELLIAYRAGEVTPLQRERVEIHLAGCSACRSELAFESELERTARAGPEPLTDLKKHQILGQIHEQIDAATQTRAPFWRRPFLMAPAGGLVAVCATFAIFFSLPGTLPSQHGWLETSNDVELFAPREAEVLFERSSEGPLIRLDSKAIFARYQRLPGHAPLRVRTPHGEAIIRGTIFFVDAQQERMVVGVQRGTVEVVDLAGHSVLVGPGEQAAASKRAVQAIPSRSPHFQALREVFPPRPALVAAAETENAPQPRLRRRPRPTRETVEAPAPHWVDPEPAPAPSPTVDPQMLTRVVGRFLPHFQSCYERGLKNDATLEGRVVAELSFGPEGELVTGGFLIDELQTPAVTDCLRDTLLRLELPPGHGEVTLQIPLVFEPTGVRQGR